MQLHHLEGLLDWESRTMWALQRTGRALPTLSQFFDYLDCRAGTLTGVSTNSGIQGIARANDLNNRARRLSGRENEKPLSCELCNIDPLHNSHNFTGCFYARNLG